MSAGERLAELLALGEDAAEKVTAMRNGLNDIIHDPLHAQAAEEVVSAFDASTTAMGHLNEAIRPLRRLADRVQKGSNGHVSPERVDVTTVAALH